MGGNDTQQCGSAQAPCDTLQYAISDRAGYGDTVIAMSGVHRGSGGNGINLSGQSVTVKGQGNAVLDCGGSGRGFQIVSGHSKLYDITVRHCTVPGHQFGGGVQITGSTASPLLANVTVVHCEAVGGGGIAILSGATPTLVNVVLRNNTAQKYGGGLYISGSGTHPTFTGCIISHNQAQNAAKGGGGAWIRSSATPSFANSTITANTAQGDGGGLYISGSGTHPTFTGFNIMSYNKAGGNGGGLWTDSKETLMTTCNSEPNFTNNHAALSGGGLFLDYAASTTNRFTALSCVGTTFIDNSVGTGYGLDFASGPAMIKVLQQPLPVAVPSLLPNLSFKLQVLDSFNQNCGDLKSASIQLQTIPSMYKTGSHICTGLLNGVLDVACTSSCSFGIQQGRLHQSFSITASGQGDIAGIHNATTDILSVADCGGALHHCKCDDPSYPPDSCKNATIGDFSCVVWHTTWLRAVSPYMAPCGVSSMETVSGDFTDKQIVNCSVGGVIEKAIAPTESQVRCAMPLNHAESCHLSATPLKVKSTQKWSDGSLNIYRYSMRQLGNIYITDSFGESPATGLYTGGKQTRNHIRFYGTQQIHQLFELASSHKISSIGTLLCKFEMGAANVTTSAWTKFWVPKTNDTVHYSFAECDPPPSFEGTTGVGGSVAVHMSFDEGQHWLPTTSRFTYHCDKEHYYVSSPNRGACTVCADGATCNGTAHVVAKDGWYPLASPTRFGRCLNKAACTNRIADQLCVSGYTGPLCSMCETGSGGKLNSFKCKKCSTRWGIDPVWSLVLYAVFSILVTTAFAVQDINVAESDDGRYSKAHVNILITIAMTGISMFQAMSFLTGFDFLWPDAIEGMLQAMQTVSGAVQFTMPMQCMVADFTSNYVYANAIIAIGLGPICVMCIGVGYVVAHVYHSVTNTFREQYLGLRRRGIIVIMHVIFLFQPGAVKGVLMVFTCYSVGDEHLLYAQMDIHCNSASHMSWQIALGTFGLLYALAFPLFELWSLCSADELIRSEDPATLRLYGFATNGCKPDYYYWPVVVMTRKVVAATVITLTRPYGIVVQALLALCVFGAALCAQIVLVPFRNPIVNILETGSILSFLITAWLGVFMSLEVVSDEWREIMSFVVLLVNVVTVLLILGAFIYAFRQQYGDEIQHVLDDTSNAITVQMKKIASAGEAAPDTSDVDCTDVKQSESGKLPSMGLITTAYTEEQGQAAHTLVSPIATESNVGEVQGQPASSSISPTGGDGMPPQVIQV